VDVIERLVEALVTGGNTEELFAPDATAWYSTTRVEMTLEQKRERAATSAATTVTVEGVRARRCNMGAVLDYVATVAGPGGAAARFPIVCIVTTRGHQIVRIEEYVLEGESVRSEASTSG
jgi:hypothetical protein